MIVSDLPEETLTRPVAIALALLRHVSQTGRFAKATIAEGQFADIRSCYPPTVLAARDGEGRVALGRGIMTLFPVMGSALIGAVALGKRCPRGPLLAVRAADRERLPTGLRIHEFSDRDLIVVDWVNSDCHLATSISKDAGLNHNDPISTLKAIRTYCSNQTLPEGWSANAELFLRRESS